MNLEQTQTVSPSEIARTGELFSPEDLQQLEVVLKKVGKRAESLAEKKGHSELG